MKTTTSYLSNLTPLRGIAALLTVIFHVDLMLGMGGDMLLICQSYAPCYGYRFLDRRTFIIAMTEGKSKGIRTARPLLPPMPWPNYIHAKKEDLVAIFAYLKSCKPVENAVYQPISPDKL